MVLVPAVVLHLGQATAATKSVHRTANHQDHTCQSTYAWYCCACPSLGAAPASRVSCRLKIFWSANEVQEVGNLDRKFEGGFPQRWVHAPAKSGGIEGSQAPRSRYHQKSNPSGQHCNAEKTRSSELLKCGRGARRPSARSCDPEVTKHRPSHIKHPVGISREVAVEPNTSCRDNAKTRKQMNTLLDVCVTPCEPIG